MGKTHKQTICKAVMVAATQKKKARWRAGGRVAGWVMVSLDGPEQASLCGEGGVPDPQPDPC